MNSQLSKSLLRSPRVVFVSCLFVVKTARTSVSTRPFESVIFVEASSLRIWALSSDVGST